MTKRTLLILSILYNLAIYGISLGGLYLEEQKEGKMTGDVPFTCWCCISFYDHWSHYDRNRGVT